MRLRADSASGYRFAAIATLSAAVAGITLLSGILRLRLSGLRVLPLIAIEPLPQPGWPHVWRNAMRSAQSLQSAALQEWLRVVLALLLTILLLAAVSALIALFAHATSRRYEVALSAVVGSTRRQLTFMQLRQAMTNAALALAAGLPAGLLAALVANRAWPHVSGKLHAAEWIALSGVFACGLAVLVARAVAARMAKPGWLGDVLAPEARTNPGYGAEDLRTALLHVQFAFTFALLAAALLVAKQSRTAPAAAMDSGGQYVTRFAVSDQATAGQRRALHAQLERALRETGETAYAVATPGALIGVGHTDQVVSNCGPCGFAGMALPMFPLRTQHHVIGAGFFAAAGYTVTKGREFEDRDEDARYIVVNDTFAHLAFQGQYPIGKTIQVGGLRGGWYTVVGVVRDVPISGLLSFTPDTRSVVRSNVPGKEPAIYFHTAEKPPAVFDVVSRAPVTIQIAGLSLVRQQRVSELLASARAPARWFAGTLGALAATAAIIAVLSLAAMTLLNVRQRELEIAARRAVGARRREIMSWVLAASAVTVARGTFVGIVLSVAVARAIQMVLPEMRILDAGVVGVTALTLGIVSLVAAAIPARAAARVPPAQVHA